MPCHGEVDRDSVTLLDAPGLEDIGDAADFSEELGVGDFTTLTRLVGLVDDGSLQGRS